MPFDLRMEIVISSAVTFLAVMVVLLGSAEDQADRVLAPSSGDERRPAGTSVGGLGCRSRLPETYICPMAQGQASRTVMQIRRNCDSAGGRAFAAPVSATEDQAEM